MEITVQELQEKLKDPSLRPSSSIVVRDTEGNEFEIDTIYIRGRWGGALFIEIKVN